MFKEKEKLYTPYRLIMKACYLALLLVGGQFQALYAGDLCTTITFPALKTQVPLRFPPDARIVSKRMVNGMCEVVINARGRDYPFYVGKKFVIAGHMFSNGKSISGDTLKRLALEEEKKEQKLFTKIRKQLDKTVVMDYKPAGGYHRTIYMFTDPVCPFCHRAEKRIKGIAEACGVEVKIIFFPVHIPKGKEKAVEAVCSKIGLDEYVDRQWSHSAAKGTPQWAQAEALLDESIALGRKLGIRAVPAFILDNGKRVIGANMDKLVEEITREGT